MSKKRENSQQHTNNLQEIILPTTKLRFCTDQLENLNFIFLKKLQKKHEEGVKPLSLALSVSERLIQRLLCCCGTIDERFSSKYLISQENPQNSNHLDYIYRIDCLSSPQLYSGDPIPKYQIIENDPDYPAAYARVRLQSATLKLWYDCINSGGYLRRDKVQSKLVELLAIATKNDYPDSPLNVDESRHCGAPGKILDPFAINEILKIQSDHQVFYGPNGMAPRFPDPRDFRLAIVDEPDGIRIKIEFLSPSLADITISCRILIGIGLDSWPNSSDFPVRIPLGHGDCLLYHQAAQTGMFLVGFGVQSSAWQIRLPGAEYTLINHYSITSSVRTILEILYDSMNEIEKIRRIKKEKSFKILNRYMFLTVLLSHLEQNESDPLTDLVNWSPIFLSTQILLVLDRIVSHLNDEFLPNYFFLKSNLMMNPGHLCDDDFLIEAKNVKSYLLRLFDESLMPFGANQEFLRTINAQQNEHLLLIKWRDLVGNLTNFPQNRRRFCLKSPKEIGWEQFSDRQLEYIGILLKTILGVKQKILQDDYDNDDQTGQDDHIEDVIYILVLIMEQAKNRYFHGNDQKNRKIRLEYNSATIRLIETIRKNRESIDYRNDLILVKTILKWLYRACETHKKSLGIVLKSYLNKIYITSQITAWHLEFIKERTNDDELHALGVFCRLINEKKITPAEGLMDSVKKNWNWAKNMLEAVEMNALRLIFISDKGRIYRHILSLPLYEKSVGDGDRKNLPNRDYFSTLVNQGNFWKTSNRPLHDILKVSSPLSLVLNEKHRRGDHRGYEDIFRALHSMEQLHVFQEIASNLPKESQLQIQELIESMQESKRKQATMKRWSNTLPRVRRRLEDTQKYTKKDESAGINDVNAVVGDLLADCRAARIRDDSGVLFSRTKNRTHLNKSQSFKY